MKIAVARLIFVGGEGSHFMNPKHTLQLSETPDFPDAFKLLASTRNKVLAFLRDVNDVNWIFVSPEADFQPDGSCNGDYILAGEEFTTNIRERISVVGK